MMKSCGSLLVVCFMGGLASLGAQSRATSPDQQKPVNKAEAYYNFAMGHIYSDLAGNIGNRGDYLTKAIEHYKAAIKADPTAAFLSEELSDLYIQAGRLRDAVTEAEESLKQNPGDLTARRILGRIYTRLIGDPQSRGINEEMLKRATEQYQKISEQDPKDLDALLMLGRLHKMAQNSVESEKAFKKALELDAENEDALSGLAMVYADLGDSARAAEMLKKVADKNPSLRALTALAGSYEQMREYALAAETLQRALAMRPDSTEIKTALANDYMLSEQLDLALKLFEELAQEEPKEAGHHLRLSQIYRQKADFKKAREANDRARKLDPTNLEIRYNDVNLLEAEGKLPEAIESLQEILSSTAKKAYTTSEKGNRAVLLERLGLLHRQNDQTAQAVETFRQIVSLDAEREPRAMAQIMDTYRQARDYKRAVEESGAAVKKYPKDRMIVMVRASILAESGNADQGARELKELFDGKGDREVWLALAQVSEKAKNYKEMGKAIDEAEKLSSTKEEKEAIWFTRGAMYEKMKRYEEAEAEFKKVLASNPASASALNYLGYMLADRNVRLNEALEMIKKAVEQEPANGAYLDSLGWVYFRLGRLEEAERLLQQAILRLPHDATIHDHLGDVFTRQGKLKEAIAAWQKSLKEWESSAPSEIDPAEIAKVQKKLEGAKVRLAKEASATRGKQR